MRIISGDFGGRTIRAPAGSRVRPTSDRVREAIFNLLATRVRLQGVEVLDLFAGSGSLGLEALSRGADRVVFVDHDSIALRTCRDNATLLGVTSKVDLRRMRVSHYLRSQSDVRFDLIFMDPPYAIAGLEELPIIARTILRPSGLIVLEHDARIGFKDHPDLLTTRSYGRTGISLFSRSAII